MTADGAEALREELDRLKSVERPRIIQAIAEARAHGDLKENAEYHAAKEEQAKIESRVIEINDLIARANVVDVTTLENGFWMTGSNRIFYLGTQKEETSFLD